MIPRQAVELLARAIGFLPLLIYGEHYGEQ